MPIERDQAATLLEALVSLVRVTRTISQRDSAHNVAATPIALLKLVSQTDPRLGDLAEQLRVKPSVASRAVASLEDEGYVNRVADPADARVCRVHITDAGRGYLKSREDWALDMVARTLSDWSPEDADMSVRVLQRLQRSVDEWVGHFRSAVSDRGDPLETPVSDAVSASTTIMTGTSESPRPANEGSKASQNPSVDGAVPVDHSKSRLSGTSKTTWETTAV